MLLSRCGISRPGTRIWGRLDEAREIVERLIRTVTRVVAPSVIPYRNPEHRELFLSGLRMAAGETT
jgi:DUF438 domain-containing protein